MNITNKKSKQQMFVTALQMFDRAPILIKTQTNAVEK